MHRLNVLTIIIVILIVFLVACSANEPQVNDNNDVVNNVADISEDNNVSIQPPQETEISAPETNNVDVPKEKITCMKDSDCGERRIENAYCFQIDPVGDIYDWKCENAGTSNARCVEMVKSGIIEECDDNEFCRKGACVKFADCNETDDGIDYDTKGKVTTNDLAVYEDKCNNDGELLEYYCSSDDRAFSEKHACDCERGACITG